MNVFAFVCVWLLGCEFARETESFGAGARALDAGDAADANEIPEGISGLAIQLTGGFLSYL